MTANTNFNFETFGIQYTNRCNFYCEHCAADSSGKIENDNIGLEFTISALDVIKKMGFKEIALTGGECLIFQNDIFQIIEKAVSKNLRVKLVSNGFWVTKNSLLKHISNRLNTIGLSKLIFSIDKFHQKFVKLETLMSAINFITKSYPDIEVEIYTVKLGENDAEQDQITELIKYKFNDLKIFTQKLLPYGRAKQLPKNLFQYLNKDTDIKTPCDQVFSPFIDHEKKLYYCSNGYILRERSPLFIKTIQNSIDLKQQIETLKESYLLKSLSTIGPTEIFGPPENEKDFISICEYCLLNMGKKGSLKIVDRFINENRITIYEIFESVKDALS